MIRSSLLPARRAFAVFAAVVSLTALSACAPATSGTAASSGSGTSGTAAASCAKDTLALKTPGKLTVGTDKPAYSPWFVDDAPANGKGFESAMAYAIAAKLGFAPTDVTWTVVKFDTLFSPKPTTFDFDLNQVSISQERRAVVDFSSGYYDVTQAVITTKGSKIAGAKTLAELKGAKLGAQRATTSYQAILDVIQPTTPPAVYPSNDNAKLALANGQIDGLVLDLPTALYVSAAELDNGVLVGQLANASGTGEQFGAVLEKGSPLTGCVSQAVDALRADGTLEALATQWLTTAGGAPVLK